MIREPEPTLEEFERDYLPTPCRCGATLSAEEAYYYSGECTDCVEGEWRELRHWRAGGANKELDEKFSGKPKVTH